MSHKKIKKIEIISSTYTNHNSMKRKINYRKKIVKEQTWTLNNMLLKKNNVNEEIKEEIRRHLETN